MLGRENVRAEEPCCILHEDSARRDRRIRTFASDDNNNRVEVTHLAAAARELGP